MPHQCTDCGRAFDDGSKEMLSGCPNCGGTKFQYKPAGTSDSESTAEPAEPPEPPEPAVDSAVARTVGNAATAVRDLVSSSSTDSLDSAGGQSEQPPASAQPQQPPAENHAQASARSEVVSPDELPPAPERFRAAPQTDHSTGATQSPPEPEGVTRDEGDSPSKPPASTPDDPTAETADSQDDSHEESSRPDLSELRKELNDQFESIRVVERGQYELNLMELYDREEYIIALQEDGKYTIQVPERWND